MATESAMQCLTADRTSRRQAAVRYRFTIRVLDRIAGRRDGRLDIASNAPSGPESAQQTDWLARNGHQFLEGAEFEYLLAHHEVTPLLVELRGALVDVAQAEVAAVAAEARYDAQPTEPAPAVLTRRGPAEAGDSDEAVAARRRAELARTRAVLESARIAAAGAVVAALHRAAELGVRVAARFDVAVERVSRLREHHEQRAAVYRRAYRRALLRAYPSEVLDHPLRAAVGLRQPGWVEAPCPWLPNRFADSTTNERTTDEAAT